MILMCALSFNLPLPAHLPHRCSACSRARSEHGHVQSLLPSWRTIEPLVTTPLTTHTHFTHAHPHLVAQRAATSSSPFPLAFLQAKPSQVKPSQVPCPSVV